MQRPTILNRVAQISTKEISHFSIISYLQISKSYFSGLTKYKNKLINEANDTLTNHATVLNFEAILILLDFGYTVKLSVHIIEHFKTGKNV